MTWQQAQPRPAASSPDNPKGSTRGSRKQVHRTCQGSEAPTAVGITWVGVGLETPPTFPQQWHLGSQSKAVYTWDTWGAGHVGNCGSQSALA